MRERILVNPRALLLTLCRIVEKANLTHHDETDQILYFAVREIVNLMKAQVGIVRLLSEDKKKLILRASYGVSPHYRKKPAIQVGKSIAGLVFEREEPIAVEDLTRNERYLYSEYAREEGIYSLICAPLKAHGNKFGSFSVYFSSPRHFHPDEVEFFHTAADFLALILVSHRLRQDLHEHYTNTIKGLVYGLEAKDSYTRGHSERVRNLAVKIARKLKLSPREIGILHDMSILHDIGKLIIDKTILQKPASLTPKEWRVIKEHPVTGENLLRPVPSFRPALPMIRHHHERFNGKGYPNGLRGETIPKLARIIAVADAFDAMTSPRPYRKAKTKEEAKKEIEEGIGKQFHPEPAHALLQLLKEGEI